MIRLLVAVACLAGMTAEASAAPLEDWLGAPHTSNLVAARRAGRIAFVLNERGVRNVFVADAPAYRPRQVTRFTEDDGRPIRSLALSPDGKTAVFVHGNERGEGGSTVNPTASVSGAAQEIVALGVDTGVITKLSDGVEQRCGDPDGCTELAISGDGARVAIASESGLRIAPIAGGKPQAIEIRGGVGSPTWSPDSKRLAFVVYRDASYIAVYRLGDATVRYLAPSFDEDDLPRWSPDGKRVAFVRRVAPLRNAPLLVPSTTPWSIWIADAATGEASAIWRSGDRAEDSWPYLASDGAFGFGAGGLLHFPSERDGWLHLYAIDPAKPGAPRLLTPGSFDVDDVSAAADGRALIVASNQGDLDRRHLWRVPLAGGSPKALTRGDGAEWWPVESGDGRLFCIAATVSTPGRVTLLTDAGLGAAITALPPSFPARSFRTPSLVVYPSEDKLPIHAQLLVPDGPATTKRPAVIFLHGGPVRQLLPSFHPMGYYHDAYAMTQYLASRGFVVLSINFRAGTNYGRAFREAPRTGRRGAAEYQDVRAAAAYLRSLPSVDPARIALWGGSYGGYLTALGLARDPDLFAAGVNYAGVTDWWSRGNFESRGAPDAEQAKLVARQSSPLSSLERWRSPVLIVHGDDDLNVDVTQSIELARRLQRQGVRVEQLALPDQTHFMTPWRTWVTTYRATAAFLERELKLR